MEGFPTVSLSRNAAPASERGILFDLTDHVDWSAFEKSTQIRDDRFN